MADRTPRRRLRPREFLAICERDGWICQICRKPVDPELEYPDHFSRSQEHTIPRSLDGSDDASNIRLAHLLCNRWKWARLDEDLLGLTPPPPGEYDPIVMALVGEAIRAAQRAASTGKPWGPFQREQFLLSMSDTWDDPEYRASLRAGQQRRRAAEKAGERPMFSDAGLEQSLSNLAKGWDPEVNARAVAKSAELRRGSHHTEDTKAKMSDSHKLAYATGKRKAVNPKLTEESVRIIRAEWAYGKSRELAERFGVSVSLIQDVANGKRWAHVA